MRKHYSAREKASIALAAMRGEKVSDLASQYSIHPNQIIRWKSIAEAELQTLFADRRKKENFSKERIIDELYRTIGQREIELSWLKKKFNLELPREVNFGE